MPYLIDADWLIAAFGQNQVVDRTLRRLSSTRISVTWITIAEVYEGAFSSANPDERLITMRHFLGQFRILNLDDRIAETFADLRSYLRRRGELIPDIDLFVVATALAHDLTVLSFNVRHLERVPDLRIYRPG